MKENYKSTQMTQESRAILKKWLKADYQLYMHFNDLLDQKIQNIGPEKIQQSVNKLKEMNENLKTDCDVKEKSITNSRSPLKMQRSGGQVTEYDMKQHCTLYATSERFYIEFLSKWQRKMSENRFCHPTNTETDQFDFYDNIPFEPVF